MTGALRVYAGFVAVLTKTLRDGNRVRGGSGIILQLEICIVTGRKLPRLLLQLRANIF